MKSNAEEHQMTNSKIYNRDCILGMKELVPTGTISMVFTDPPYGIEGR